MYGKVSEALCLTDDDTFESFYNNYDLSLTYSSEFDLLRTKYYREEEYTVIEADPVAVYTSDETKDINQIKADIIPYLESTRAQFVTGELNFEGDWDNYINTLNNMGLEDLMALEQAALDRTLGS